MKEVGGDVYGKMKISVTAETLALEMLKCFRPQMLVIKKPDDENKIGYQLECNCDWEIDILDNKVVYLSSYNGYSPWRKYVTDEYNYINQI